MSDTSTITESDIASAEELRLLREELTRLNNHRFIRLYNSFTRLILFNLMRGMAFGLGTVLGASVLLSLVAWFIAQIEFLPIINDLMPMIGEWAAEVSRQMQEAR